MTVREILAEVDRKHPNNVDTYYKWGRITQMEKLLLDECLMTHQISEDEQKKAQEIAALATLEEDYEPLAQPPYHDLYVHYVAAQIAAINADTDMYANESALYNNALLTYKNYFNRTHRSMDGGQRWRF